VGGERRAALLPAAAGQGPRRRAGGGREALALAAQGYEVLAYEPSPPLVAALAGAGAGIDARRGGYGDMRALAEREERFGAAILGWASFSHLRSEAARVDALELFARITDGPIVVSFLGTAVAVSRRLALLRRLVPRRAGRSPGDVFSATIGYYHPIGEDEARRLAAEAGLRVLELTFDERDTNWPYAVLAR
jgi:hypothetical protein